MTNLRFYRDDLAAAATLALLLAAIPACATDVDEPTQEDYDDVAAAIAPIVAQDVGASGTLATIAAAARGQSLTALDGESSLAAANASLQWSVELVCSDASGTPQVACNAQTDAAEINASFNGSLEIARYSASLSASGRWTLSGLQSGTVTVTGDQQLVAASSFTSVWRNETRTFDLDLSKGYELSFPTLSARDAQGSLRGAIDANRTIVNPNLDIDKRFDIDIAIELPGDRTAIVILDGVARYRVDLDTGRVDRV